MSPLSFFSVAIAPLLLAHLCESSPYKNQDSSSLNEHDKLRECIQQKTRAYAAIYMQLILGFKRRKRGSRARSAWYLLHCLVGVLNIYTGLQAYHIITSTNTRFYTIIFTAQLSFMVILYLFQDKWDYILRQGMPPGVVGSYGNNDIPLPITLSQQVEDDRIKDSFNEPSMKSNDFSRTNVLNKLFQLA
ncbi:hypothetical protein SASPL_117083 [Salvia splendens]|uniref:Uncharacterized protein n=1 Tax=Salvia splendens TaxID=180675 RepID=A0A8X8ZXT9_SALSN|nr:hypothetical protein SASPL_117083 [Salvia splendens]